MKYQYVTTILCLDKIENTYLHVNPPDDSGWSLLSMNISPQGNALFYTWAKEQKPLAQFSSSDAAFQKSLDMIQSNNIKDPIVQITDVISRLDENNKTVTKFEK